MMLGLSFQSHTLLVFSNTFCACFFIFISPEYQIPSLGVLLITDGFWSAAIAFACFVHGAPPIKN